MSTRQLLIATLLLSSLPRATHAQVGAFGPQQGEVKGVVLRCKVVCIACELQRMYGVGGHDGKSKHILGVRTAEGLMFTFLPNAAAEPLINDAKWLGKELDLNGRTFPKTMVIEVFRFKEIDPTNPQARQLMYFCYV
jgi:hypothetical protein